VGSYGPVDGIDGDGRFAYLQTGGRTTVVDAGAWTFDHGEHNHSFATEPAEVATLDVPTASVSASHSIVAIETITGTVDLLDREKL
ncbi:ABC transporter, partial [Mycobacterium sp. ITM-2017-0098]